MPSLSRYQELLERKRHSRSNAHAADVVNQLANMLAPQKRFSEMNSGLESVREEIDELRNEIESISRHLSSLKGIIASAERPSEAISSETKKLREDLNQMLRVNVRGLEASLNALAARPQKEVDLTGVQSEIARLASKPVAERTEIVEVPVAPSELKLSVVNRDKKGNINTVKIEVVA